MQLKLDQLITIVWDQNSGHISLNARPNGAVSVRKKLFSEHHGRFSPGRCPQPQRQPQHLQRDDLPGEHIARDHRSHPSRFSFLEQKVFSVLKKICVSRRRLRRQWEWTGRAWLPSSYSTSQCSWWKTWQCSWRRKNSYCITICICTLYIVQYVTVQAFLGCANVHDYKCL